MRKIFKIFDMTAYKFILVGIFNTVLGFGIMVVLYNFLHFNYWFSSAMNYIVGSIASFFLNKYFTFQNKEKSYKQILFFIVNILFCYLIAYGIAKPFVGFILQSYPLKLQENIALIFGTILFICLNYLGQRFVVFTSLPKWGKCNDRK